MKNFYCQTCGTRVFFVNSVCLSCGASLGFDLESREMVSLGDGEAESADASYKPCQNYQQHATCNWALPADSPESLCRSCRLTEIIPDLSEPENRFAWGKIEEAKRRLVFNLDQLGLRPEPRGEDNPDGLLFRFLADADQGQSEPVLTGHAEGIVTLNIAEANDAERERRRLALGEPYRTLLGHLRHEVGHYYWDRLVRRRDEQAFRYLFGDERVDYAESLQRYYKQGAPADWGDMYISAYATAHPWEDWAETWAHYLHMMDSLGTALDSKVSVGRTRPTDPSFDFAKLDMNSFDSIVTSWPAVACMINSFNRSLGMPDAYPFVIAPRVVEKLRYVHDTVVG